MRALEDLKNHIEAQTSIFHEYQNILERKERALIDGNYDELNIITRDEEVMVVSIDEAEKRREALSADLCDTLTIDRESSVSEIAEAVGEEEGTKFMVLIARLLECLQEISHLHYTIEKMISFQLKNVNLLRDTVTGQERINTYNIKGKYQQDMQKKMFNGKG